MNRAKQIEAGCRALIVGGSYGASGEVTVIRFIGDIDRMTLNGVVTIFPNSKYWEVDRKLNTSEQKNVCPYMPEKKLIRIDDPDIQSQIESESSIPVIVR